MTALSSCCAWNGTTCLQSLTNTCYNNKKDPPEGAKFCEDFKSFKNQTLCLNISGTPWYMPCKWNNLTSECQFKGSTVTGGSGGFKDINSKSNCEAGGGQWREKNFIEAGISRSDSWCEFKFGSSGNCNSSCWACEKQNNGTNWPSLLLASTACNQSSVGFCNFKINDRAENRFGYCDAKKEFNFAGGNCQKNCGDCNVMNNPQNSCTNSPADCKWVLDPVVMGKGFCEKKSAKTCNTDCFKCQDSQSCTTFGKGKEGACNWDGQGFFCKPSGFDGEICFDGEDNDNDGKTDCGDSNCGFDAFCGGDFIDDKNCGFQSNESNCNSTGCVWLRDDFDIKFNTTGHCGFPGEQCMQYDENETKCNATSGCGFLTQPDGFCEVNRTVEDQCFNLRNLSSCDGNINCSWKADGFNSSFGFCGHKMFTQCEMNFSKTNNRTACELDQLCAWEFAPDLPPQGECAPKCFVLNSTQCRQNSTCELIQGLCDPLTFSSDCADNDGNRTNCANKNVTCEFIVPPGGADADGLCENKFGNKMFQDMGNQPPVILGFDVWGDVLFGTANASNVSNSFVDIEGFGVKDNKNSYMFGTRVRDIGSSAACRTRFLQNMSVGMQNYTVKFFWYLDTDGNSTNHCTVHNNSAQKGFEFFFSYTASIVNNQTVESTSSKWCTNATNASWAPVPIPVSVPSDMFCSVIGGPAIGIDKKTIQGFDTFDKSANIRAYVTTADASRTENNVSDSAGPGFYTQGAVDFAFEDCQAKGQDLDGDGLNSENDPDCTDFLRRGFVTIESGPMCKDGQDNDQDDLTDCLDTGCKQDPFFCGGNYSADANDKTAPKLVWFETDEFPEGAHIRFDTNEPSNGTILFYHNDSSCITINKTINDFALQDVFMPDYNVYHQVGIDNFAFNPIKLGYNLLNATDYYYKTQNCDPSNNCAISKCLNFTTEASIDDCTACRATIDMAFVPRSGSAVSDAMGNVAFGIRLPNGTSLNLTSTVSINHTSATNVTITLENPNSTTGWKIEFEEATLKKLSATASNMSSSSISYNVSNITPYVGVASDTCQLLISELRPKTLKMCIPGNITDLYQCGDELNLSNCVNKSANATKIPYNTTSNNTCWRVPADWGC